MGHPSPGARPATTGRRWPALELRFPAVADPALGELLSAALDDFQPTAIQEHERDRGSPTWQVFFATPDDRDRALERVLTAFGDQGVVAVSIDLEDEDWAARSQASLRAVRVGRLVVAPPWDLPSPRPPGTRTIVIEPSMGFGTGHHATTRLCLEALQMFDLSGKSVLDIGTGSGLLAIAVAMEGATPVWAIDTDEDALASARDNAARNGVDARIAFERTDFRHAALPQAEVVVANLTGAILVAGFDRLVRATAPNGLLVLSGFTSQDLVARPEGPVIHAPTVAAMDTKDEEGWRCLVLRRT